MIPGTALVPTSKDTQVPVMLVQSGNGWDLIVPEGWGLAFWKSIVFTGAKAAGRSPLTVL